MYPLAIAGFAFIFLMFILTNDRDKYPGDD